MAEHGSSSRLASPSLTRFLRSLIKAWVYFCLQEEICRRTAETVFLSGTFPVKRLKLTFRQPCEDEEQLGDEDAEEKPVREAVCGRSHQKCTRISTAEELKSPLKGLLQHPIKALMSGGERALMGVFFISV